MGNNEFPVEFTIYNLTGTVITKKMLLTNENKIERASIQNGIYFYLAKFRNGKQESGKLIVQ
jgi:hypothetical protein